MSLNGKILPGGGSRLILLSARGYRDLDGIEGGFRKKRVFVYVYYGPKRFN